MVRLSSTNEKICGDCRAVTKWDLASDQIPLVANNRMKENHDDKG